MSISGSLEDVSVADVLQFIHLGRRTGTLYLTRGDQRARVGFHYGRLVSAGGPGTPKLGDLLVSRGLVDRTVLERAAEVQKLEPQRRSLGQILVSVGAIEGEQLWKVIADQIEQTISELVQWDKGTFEFAVDDLHPIDDFALYPGDVLPDADLNTQMVLLEAARIFDEKNRAAYGGADSRPPAGASGPPPKEPAGGVEGSGEGRGAAARGEMKPAVETAARGGRTSPAEAPRDSKELTHPSLLLEGLEVEIATSETPLHLITWDDTFAARLKATLPPTVATLSRKGLEDAGVASPEEIPPIVLVDLRHGRITQEELKSFHRKRPLLPIIALVDPGTPFGSVYAAGALAALPPEVEAVVACVENIIESRRELRSLERDGVSSKEGVARLRRVFGDLRSGLISATVALHLMHIISESVERAVLFLVKRDHLPVLGAFGTGANGQPLAQLTRGLRLGLEERSAFTESLTTGQAVSVSFEEANLPEPFKILLGRPYTDQVVVFPVLGAERVIAVIYTDNADLDRPIEDIEILELATAQVGMAFENELLRRQIAQQKA